MNSKAITVIVFGVGLWVLSIGYHNIAQSSEEGNQKKETSNHNPNPFTEVDTLLPSLDRSDDTWRKIVDSSPKSLSLKRNLSPGESVFVGIQEKGNNSLDLV